MTGRARGAVIAAALALALSATAACAVPQRKSDLSVTKIAAQPEEIGQVYERYAGVRANALKLLDPEPLRTIESGPVLAIDAGSLQVARRLSQTREIDSSQDLTVETVLAPRLGAYPLWFVAVVRDGVREVIRVQIFQRDSATSQWEMVASPETLVSTVLPSFALDADSALESVDAGDADGLALAPQAAVDAYAAALADPSAPGATYVLDDSFIEQMREAATASASIKGVEFSQDWGAKPVQYALRTSNGGALVFATLLRQDSYDIADGRAVNWPEGSEQKALLAGKLYTAGILRYYHQVLMYVPPDGEGKPRVLGQYGGVVSGDGS